MGLGSGLIDGPILAREDLVQIPCITTPSNKLRFVTMIVPCLLKV